MRTKLLLVSGLAALSCAAFAQQTSVAATLGVYYPSINEIKSLIGSQFLTYGVTLWGGNSTSGGMSPELDAIEGSGNGNNFLLVPFTYGYEKDFRSSLTTGTRGTGMSFVPYIRAGAGVCYFDYSIFNGHQYDTQRLGGTANVEAGLKISNTAKVFVKYNWFTPEQEFNFSGIEIGIVYSLFHL